MKRSFFILLGISLLSLAGLQSLHAEPTLTNKSDIVYELQCGNGVVDPGEECDDGNSVDGDDCSNFCRRKTWDFRPVGTASQALGSVCGDRNVYGSEQCDDGNHLNGDGCDEDCQIEPIFPLDTDTGTAETFDVPKEGALEKDNVINAGPEKPESFRISREAESEDPASNPEESPVTAGCSLASGAPSAGLAQVCGALFCFLLGVPLLRKFNNPPAKP